VLHHNPWLGYGLWTVWRFQNFRREAQAAVGWPIEVIDAHNGFMDVLLFLGFVGLVMLLAVIARALWCAVADAVRGASVDSLWPLLTVGYVVTANLTISFFFQFESFHWFLLVAVMFAASQREGLRVGVPASPETGDPLARA
jgi:O-antigen ligase